MDWPRAHARLFRALLYCYPAEFRHEYGGEMERLFEDRLREEPRWRLWRDAVADLAFSAPREHASLLASDLRYAARTLAAAPAFAAMALLITALGIGATVSVFSVVNAVLLRSLPYGHPGRLVYLFSPNRNFQGVPEELGPNIPDFYDWQRLSHGFSQMTLLRPAQLNLVEGGESARVDGAFVAGNFFRTLEVRAWLGRTIGDGDDRPGHELVAVISGALWRSRFGSDPRIVGRRIQLNRRLYTIVGVMPEEFGYPFDGDIPYESSATGRTDVWLPAAYTAAEKADRVNFESADAIGRLRDGVPAPAAEAELAAIEKNLQPRYAAMWRGFSAMVRPVVETIIGPVEKMLWLLLGAIGIVLLIAVANVANLLLARAAGRGHEMGIRTALGAGRGRLVRQMLTESLLVSLVGGALGVALAYAAVRVLTRLNPGGIPRFDSAGVDGRVLLVALALSIGAGLAAGMAPALAASRASVNELLKSGGTRIAGPMHRGRFALIVAEVALSVVLVTASTLLIRSYLALTAVQPGFSPATLTFQVRLDDRYSTPALQAGFERRFLEKLKSLAGAGAVGASSSTPLSKHESVTFAEIRGFGRAPSAIENYSVTPDYRKALGVPLLAGRDFDARDTGTPVVIVNREFAQAYFAGRNPLGGEIRSGVGDLSAAPWLRVVGVIAGIRHNALDEPSLPLIWQPADEADRFALECRAPAGVLAGRARAALRSLDPVLTLDDVRTMRQRMGESSARRRFQTTLLTGFAALAVALALSGLYALMAFSVRQRRQEIGVRIALGASRGRVVGMILSQGLRMTAWGLVIGLAASFAATRLIAAWLFGVRATDPVSFAAVPLFVAAVACCACIAPAWNAARIRPMEALRQE